MREAFDGFARFDELRPADSVASPNSAAPTVRTPTIAAANHLTVRNPASLLRKRGTLSAAAPVVTAHSSGPRA